MKSLIRPVLVLFALLTLITGILYPLTVTLVGHLFFPAQAGGSVVREGERVLGSALVGQPFSDPRYIWSRPSAVAPFPYNAVTSSGSNQGPSNPALHDAVRSRIAALRSADPGNVAAVPVDLVTASGSGLDPHVSPAAASYQAARIARARGISEQRVHALIEARIEGRSFGLLGEPRVNVLLLNLDLDRAAATGP